MAEREGFEPPCRLPDKTLSRRPRYDHFGTSPFITSLDGAPFTFPISLRARGAASRHFPPALACGRRRFVLRSMGPFYSPHLAARSGCRLAALPSGPCLRPQALPTSARWGPFYIPHLAARSGCRSRHFPPALA